MAAITLAARFAHARRQKNRHDFRRCDTQVPAQWAYSGGANGTRRAGLPNANAFATTFTNLMGQSDQIDGWTASPAGSVAFTANAIANPLDGTVTADKIITNDTALNGHQAFKTYAGAVSSYYTAFVFVKAGDYTRFDIQFSNTAFASTTRGILVDLTNGNIVAQSANTDAKVWPWGNGWYLCAITGYSDNDGGNYVLALSPKPAAVNVFDSGYTPAAVGLGAYAFRAMVFAGRWLEQIPPFVSSSQGTGPYARTQLLAHTQDLTDPTWSQLSAVYTISKARAGSDAHLDQFARPGHEPTKFVRGTNATTDPVFARQAGLLSVFTPGTYTASIDVYVPSGQGIANWGIQVDAGDTENGTRTFSTTFDRWVRISSTVTLDAARNSLDFDFYYNNGAQLSGANAGFVFYAQAPMLEAGPYMTTYVPNAGSGTVMVSTPAFSALQMAGTNVPRIDYTDDGAGRGIRMEGPSTNLFLNSDDFSGWTVTSATRTAQQKVAPDGSMNGILLVGDNGAAAGRVTKAPNFVAGTTYAMSAWIAPAGKTSWQLFMPGGAFNNNQVRFATFTLAGAGAVSAVSAGCSAYIEQWANGWYRCVFIFTCEITVSTPAQFRDSANGDGINGVFMWGAQMEANYFASTYVTSGGVAVGRTGDQLTCANLAALAFDAVNGYSFAVGWDIAALPPANVWPTIISLRDGASQNYLRIYVNNAAELRVDVIVANVLTSTTVIAAGVTASPPHRIACVLKATGFAVSYDGALPVSVATALPMALMTTCDLGVHGNTNSLNGCIANYQDWARLITTPELITYSKHY